MGEVRRWGGEHLALTDINSTSGMLDFARLCRENGIHPIHGVEFRNDNARHFNYIGLAYTTGGIHHLNHFLSRHLEDGTPFPRQAPFFEGVYFIYPLLRKDMQLRENELIGIRPNEVHQLPLLPARMRARAVALPTITFLNPQQYRLHKTLRAVAHNTLVNWLPTGSTAPPDAMLRSADALKSLYADAPWLLRHARKLAECCTALKDVESNKNKKTFTGNRKDDLEMLHQRAYEGLGVRYGRGHEEARKRLKKELNIIAELDFAAYFLITYDLVQYARRQGLPYAGRGSGANSITAFCLQITDVDPVALDLYFERFLNPNRDSPPDFDMDFSWKDRDRMVSYLFRQYGYEHTAFLGAVSTFRFRAAVREVAAARGIKPDAAARLIKQAEEANLQQKEWKPENPVMEEVWEAAMQLRDFPRHITMHAGGVLITEEPVRTYTATLMPPKGFPTTHIDMYTAEDAGLFKFDVLSQRGLGHIRDAIRMVGPQRPEEDIHDIRRIKEDPAANDLLARGETIGCFYIESPAMRMLLRKLGCRNYEQLVAASSIIRPGVSRSGMMKEYIHRHRRAKEWQALHPVMEELLGETYGIMVYQEDVIKVAHHFAGISPEEADLLRRAMSGKSRGKHVFEQLRQSYFEHCRQKGRDPAIAEQIWKQIESFAGYSFSKAHSASYAVESYQSLYLKAHYPLTFITAVLNNFGGFYDTAFYLNEAARWGAQIEKPCVNTSRALMRLKGHTIYMGLICLKGFGTEPGEVIVNEREKGGSFTGLSDFVFRTGLGFEQVWILIKADAFRFTGMDKRHLYWEALRLKRKRLFRRSPQMPGLPMTEPEGESEAPDVSSQPLSRAEVIRDECEVFGFPLSPPWELLQSSFRGDVKGSEIAEYEGQTVRMAGYLVTVKTTRTVNGQYMQFGHFLDDRGETFDTVMFPDVVKQTPLSGKNIYAMKGVVTSEYGVAVLEVQRIRAMRLEI